MSAGLKGLCSRQSCSRSIKRSMDIVGATAGLVVAAPVLLVAATAICLTMDRPILFRQARPGRNGSVFTLLKLRTMRSEHVVHGRSLSDAERLTTIGRALRRTSVDELPQLWNVLRGEMSLVGPRPLLVEYLERYTPWQARRHEVRPGITGWAQINGRQDIPFSRRLELDIWYVDNWSLWLDVRIIMLTMVRLIGMTGVRLGQEVSEVDDLALRPDSVMAGREESAPEGE